MARPARRPAALSAETTSFVGRRHELAEIKRNLISSRVVSLVGPGGVGKTRLAVRAAAELARGFRDGARLVELAEVRDADLTGVAFAEALDLRSQAAAEPIELVCGYLADKRLLLVVDNCEHVLDEAAAAVSGVLKGAPGVRVLTTSREPLSMSGEHVVPIPPLQLPSAEGEPLSRLRQNEAVSLFCERAAAAAGRFDLDESNMGLVVELCRRLDGLPLAIELAAVRMRHLSLDEILARLSDRFSLLTHRTRAAVPRHQTLETTIDWSHDLLAPPERTLFRRLSLFAGRFTLKDAEAVADARLEVLWTLVERSLVIKEGERGVAAYRLHETMREYARRKLDAAGEADGMENRMADYYVKCASRFGMDTRFRLLEWLAWADLEMDNVRAVLTRCVSRGDLDRGLALTTAMGWTWITHATSEGMRWFDRFLVWSNAAAPAPGWSYFMRGFLSTIHGDAAGGRLWLDRAVSAARAANDLALLTHALAMASVTARMAFDREAGVTLLDEAMATVSRIDDVAAKLGVLQSQIIAGYFDGNLESVRAASTAGIDLARKSGELYALEVMLGELAGTYLLTGDVAAAKPLYSEGLRTARIIDDRVTQFYYVDALAALSTMAGNNRQAAQLLGASRAMQIAAGATPLAFMAPIAEQAEKMARSVLGESKFAAEVEMGMRMSRDAGLALATGEIPHAEPKADDGGGVLGKRETEIARLVAEGLTNKEIGARLFISRRTVDAHMRSIMNKLGFNSRAQIAAWVE